MHTVLINLGLGLINEQSWQLVVMCMCTWVMEAGADHSRTYHYSKGSVELLAFYFPCLILLRAGKLVSVTKHVTTD